MNYIIGAFKPPCNISITFVDGRTRKKISVKKENGQTAMVPLFQSHENIVGEVSIEPVQGKKVEHNGVKIELLGQIELYFDRGNFYDFTSLVRELDVPGEIYERKTYPFEFSSVEMPYESYNGVNVRLRYILKVTISRNYVSNIVDYQDFWVHETEQSAMECVFGLVGDGFAIVVADTSAVNSILVHKSNEDKIMLLDSHKLMGASGEGGDRVQFTEYIQKNVHLYQFRNGIPLTTRAAANFTRGELATALRKNPYFVNILLAGYDKETGPSLYFIDYIATLHKIDKGAFGYGSYFALSMMDRHYHKGMTVEEAVDLIDKCIMEIRSRLVVAPPNFVIKIVDKDGAREYGWRESIKPI